MNKEVNPYTHYYLYAKGWYACGDILEDLKKIQENYTGISSKYLTERDVYQVLSEISFEEMSRASNPKYIFDRIMTKMMNGDIWNALLTPLCLCLAEGRNK
jgi:hypothetical protein